MDSGDIIRMAREARLAEPYHPMNPWSASQEALERFAALVAAREREACAQLAENGLLGLTIAKAIRARGEQ
jgi:hypothetical protein